MVQKKVDNCNDKNADIKDIKDDENPEKSAKVEEAQVVEENEKENKEEETDKVAELQKKYDDLTAKYLLISADFDNYRKRMIKERAELIKTAGANIFEGLLPVMDNFDRAVQSMEKATDVPSLREGVVLIHNEFKNFLEQNGVKEIPCVGEVFTTDMHEAVARIPAPSDADKGKVIECARKGYTLNGKVIRFARAVVGD